MGFQDDIRERERKSLERYAVTNVLEEVIAYRNVLQTGGEVRQRKAKDIAHLDDAIKRAMQYVEQVDKAYEIVSRMEQMLKQLADGDWPITEVPGIAKAASHTKKLLL